MPACGCGDLAIERGDCGAFTVPLGLELAPNVSSAGVEAQNASSHSVAEVLEPDSQCSLALAVRKAFYATANLPYGHGADIKLPLIFAEPSDDFCVWPRSDRLTEDICVHKEAHNAGGSESSVSRGGIWN